MCVSLKLAVVRAKLSNKNLVLTILALVQLNMREGHSQANTVGKINTYLQLAGGICSEMLDICLKELHLW